MTMHSWIVADAAQPISQDMPAAAGQLARSWPRFWHWLAVCRTRAAERRELRELDEHALRDLPAKRVREEAAKPFWVE